MKRQRRWGRGKGERTQKMGDGRGRKADKGTKEVELKEEEKGSGRELIQT